MMHSESFLHRDIAPDNIMVRADVTPVLLDFGAARRAVDIVLLGRICYRVSGRRI
jgi:serine/threonine protein kinase